MKKTMKILTVILTLAMLLALTACGSGSNAQSGDASADVSEALQGVYDTFVANEDYTMYKSYYPDATFEETLDSDGITVTISGSDDMDGTFTFPAKDGYLICEMTGDDYIGPMLFTTIVRSVAEYYGINPTLFSAYINGLGINDIESPAYAVEQNDDGSGTMQIYYEEKPEMPELDDLYINEAALDVFDDSIDNFTTLVGKLAVNCVIDSSNGTLSFAIGEYGDENTELTYKSIVEIVKHFQPNGYEDFLNDYTELADVSTDEYTVNADVEAYQEEHGIELIDGYTFMFVVFG